MRQRPEGTLRLPPLCRYNAGNPRNALHRFYWVNSDRSRQTEGSGLGLAIATAIIEAHGGTIEVESELNRGSTFTIKLPLNN